MKLNPETERGCFQPGDSRKLEDEQEGKELTYSQPFRHLHNNTVQLWND